MEDSALDEWAVSGTIRQLQIHLSDALEKNKQWLEYDQQREAYVRAMLARMLWLEKQLNEANQARSQQHNEDHSDERRLLHQMQENYEGLLQKVKDLLEALREQVDMAQQKLITTENWYKERESEVEEFKQLLQTGRMIRLSAPGDHHCSEDREQWLSAESENPQDRMEKERRRSANFELQSTLFQKCLLNHHHADQERIADLERQLSISTQDLEDEKQNCLYLIKKVLRMRQKSEDHVTEQSKGEQQEGTSCEEPPPLCSSLLSESFLECPGCRAEYPASHYRELMSHLEICLD